MGGFPSTDKHPVPKCSGSVRTRVFTFAACNLHTFPLYQITSLTHQTIKKVKSKMYITVHQYAQVICYVINITHDRWDDIHYRLQLRNNHPVLNFTGNR